MDKIPFSVYDFFAYLSSGAVLLVTADYVAATGLLFQKELGTILGVVLILLAYVCGQIVAHFSSWLLEKFVVGRVLRNPSLVLLGEKPTWRSWPWIFRNYFCPLPAGTQHRVFRQAQARGVSGKGEALFLHAYPIATASIASLQGRLDDFRNQYGFARNMSFAFLVAALAIVFCNRLAYHPVRLSWAVLAGIAGISLFYRYLKFFRQFSYELLIRYAELPLPEVRIESKGA